MYENFGLKTKKLHQLGVIETPSPRDTVLAGVCSEYNLSFMYRNYSKCKDKLFPITRDPSTNGNIITQDEWETKSVPLTKKYKDGAMDAKDIRNVLLEKRHTSTSRHIYNARHQFQRLRSLRETLTRNDIVVHIDYSEIYAYKYNREIRETHFEGGNKQVTLHIGVLCLGGGKVESFASLSECLQHDATATWAHLDPVLRGIPEEHPNARNLHLISGGPTSIKTN